LTGSARYLAHEAGHLAGVPGDRIGQWARWGHIQASVSAGDPHVYAFDDVAEAIAVHELLECGLRLSVIRRAVAELDGPAGWPLSRAGLHVVHGRLAVARGSELVELLGMGAQEILPFDGRLDPVATLRAGGWPARVLGLRSVEVDPERLGGRPVLRGRRIAVRDALTFDDPAEHEIDAETIQEARAWLQHD
jgi:hypothetical protein